MKILICGSRYWTNKELIAKTLSDYLYTYALEGANTTIIHGNAKGADRLGAECALELGITDIHPFHAKWNQYGNAAGPIRNQEMLMAKPDIVFAFHNDISRSRGTGDMIKRCQKANIPYKLITE